VEFVVTVVKRMLDSKLLYTHAPAISVNKLRYSALAEKSYRRGQPVEKQVISRLSLIKEPT
jgi:hypothetical protein